MTIELKPKHWVLALIVLVIIASLYYSRGGGVGTCTLYCTSKEYGNQSTHGPYDNYTQAECEEKIETTQTILTDCTWEWERY